MKPLLCVDMDETIIRSNKVHVKAFNKAFIKYNLKPINEKKLAKALQGEESEVIIKKFYPNLPNYLIEKIHRYKRKIVIKETYKYAKQIKNSGNILKNLKKNHRIAILSNCTYAEAENMIKGAKIKENSYDILIGKDEVKHAKPYPDEIFKAENLIRERAEFMIGDSMQDIKAAKRAKVPIISVLTGNTPKKEILRAKPNYIIKDISKLKGLLM